MEAAAQEAATHETRLRRLGTIRLLAFVAALAPLLALETTPRSLWPVLLGVAGVAALAFGFLVARHRSVRRRLDRSRVRMAVSGDGPARLARRWDDLPLLELDPPGPDHPFAGDLDVVGYGSLAHLLGTPRTLPGRRALREALLGHATKGEEGDRDRARTLREERREAMDALSRDPELLEAVQVAARTLARPADPAGLERFRQWAAGPAWRPPGVQARWLLAARLLTAVNAGLLVGWFSGWPPFWIGGAALALVLWSRVRADAHARFDAVEGAETSLGQWSELLDVAARLPTSAPLLARLREGASSPVEGAEALARLRRISDWAQIRRSSLVYFPLALVTAWDVHPLVPMERWRARYGAQVERWLEAVGELELLVALAVLRFDHPDWCLPTEQPPESAGLLGEALRHPLLPPAVAVGNEVVLPPAGELLLVTGSNMSGKSTLLRAVGANQILMLAGGPVAAARYAAPPLVPWSSMRIRDSLTDGISLFMAELQRLKRVVDAARREPVLVLLDEILQGTNTAERRMAARTILGHLMSAGAVGAVSTHDLTLADAPELATRLTQVHLKEEVREVDGVRTLTFDHRLRAGPATSRNALILLELVGLGAEGASDRGPDEG